MQSKTDSSPLRSPDLKDGRASLNFPGKTLDFGKNKAQKTKGKEKCLKSLSLQSR